MATSIGFNIYAKDNASAEFLRVAAAVKLANSSVSDMGAATLGLTKLIGGAGLIPVLAGATAAASELGVALGAAAGAGSIFALSAGGIFMDMQKAQQAIKVTDAALSKLTPGTAEYTAKLAELHAQQQAFNKDFGPAAKGYDAMTGAFAKFKQATSGVSNNVLGKGFGLIASVLPRLVPVSNAAGRAVGGLLDDLKGWTKSPAFAGVLHWFETSGPKAITHFGHSVGNIFVGLGGIFKNFIAPGDKAAKTLEHLTARFAKWGNSKGVSHSVDQFLKYVSGNGGKITSVLQSLATILPKLAVAAGGLGSANLSAISMFLNLLAGMNQGTFDIVVKGLFGIAVAAKAAAIVGGLTTMFKAAAAATAFLGEASIGTRIALMGIAIQEKAVAAGTLLAAAAQKVAAVASKAFAAAQWLVNAALDANPIGLVVVALAALAAGLVYAYKHSATFRAIVQGAFRGVQAAASAVAGFFTRQIPAAFNKVRAAASNTLGWVKSNWPIILAVLTGPIGLAVLAIAKNWDKIKAGASNLVDFFKSIPGKIKSALGNMGKLLYSAGVAIIQGLIDGIQSKVGDLLGMVGNLGSSVSNGFKSALGIHSPSRVFLGHGVAIMEGLVKGIESRQVAVQTVLTKVTAAVQASGQKLKDAISARDSFAGGFQSFSTSLFGATSTTDADGNTVAPTASSIIAYQKAQAAQAKLVKVDVRKLVHMGLSPALIKQLQAQGAAGIPEIQALAAGSKKDIRQLNALNKQTSSDLQSAGMTASNRLYGQQIAQDRKHYDDEKKLLGEIRDLLKHNHNQVDRLEIQGQTLVAFLKKVERTTGAKV